MVELLGKEACREAPILLIVSSWIRRWLRQSQQPLGGRNKDPFATALFEEPFATMGTHSYNIWGDSLAVLASVNPFTDKGLIAKETCPRYESATAENETPHPGPISPYLHPPLPDFMCVCFIAPIMFDSLQTLGL